MQVEAVRVIGPAQPAELLLDVTDRLAVLQIPFALVGALAAVRTGK